MRVVLISLILSMFLIGCTTLNYNDIPNNGINEKKLLQKTEYFEHKKSVMSEDATITSIEPHDPIEDYIKQFPIKKKTSNTAYVNADNLAMLSSPKIGVVINHISRGEKVFILETKMGWVNISADQERPYWIDAAQLCYLKNCWVSSKKNDENSYSTQQTNQQEIKKEQRKVQNANQSLRSQKQKNQSIYSPKQSNKIPNGATARCLDKTWSFSQNRRGTCSHHGGVVEWQ